MYSPRSILSSIILSKGRVRPRGVTTLDKHGLGVLDSAILRRETSWWWKASIALRTEEDTVSWITDIWAGENNKSPGCWSSIPSVCAHNISSTDYPATDVESGSSSEARTSTLCGWDVPWLSWVLRVLPRFVDFGLATRPAERRPSGRPWEAAWGAVAEQSLSIRRVRLPMIGRFSCCKRRRRTLEDSCWISVFVVFADWLGHGRAMISVNEIVANVSFVQNC